MDLRLKLRHPYFQRWIEDAEIYMCHVELDSLQRSVGRAYELLYLDDREELSFDNLKTGFFLRQINALLLSLNGQKKFLTSSEDKPHKIKIPLAYLPDLHWLVRTTKEQKLVRLRGNIETVLEKYGYQFEEIEPVREIDAHIEDLKRFVSDHTETY